MLKPDWSPRFEMAHDYIGRAVFLRASLIAGHLATLKASDPEALRRSVRDMNHLEVAHLRRLMLASHAQVKQVSRASSAVEGPLARGISIIIPTKDQLNLLKACLSGLLESTDENTEIIIVDNESNETTLAFYRTLPAKIRILPAPGPFNFSTMCNAGAAIATGECLVFLNNDMEVIEPGWLAPLVAEAMREDIGAVGATLLFPDGKIQHAGVTVGMGGFADHTSHSLEADDPGYLQRLAVLHEVSAVTGACICVEARKFREIGGFDADHLPVELNDIDLCLRLSARGWITLMCPAARLIHHQSATRGFAYRPFTRYEKERTYFRRTWASVIRDDPYFHPALSLFSVVPALDG